MFGFFKNKSEDEPSLQTPEVLGIRVGGCVELNDLKLRLIEGEVTFANVSKQQLIQAVGTVQLDENTTIFRFYTDDDGFIQVVTEGGTNDEHVTDVKLWFYYETKSIAGDKTWNDVLDNHVSQPTYELDGKTYSRLWEDMNEDTPPVAMTETTYGAEDENEEDHSSTDQFVMLYEREVNENLEEFLMVSAEEVITENDDIERCLVTSTGINLSAADFETVS